MKKEICIQARMILRTSSKYHTSKAFKDKKFKVQNVHMNRVQNVHMIGVQNVHMNRVHNDHEH